MEQNRLTYAKLRSYCRVQSPSTEDSFVGFRVIDNCPEVSFPLGYRFPSKFEQLQADISALITLIQRAHQTFPAMQFPHHTKNETHPMKFPFQDYVILIEDYLQTSTLYSETLSDYRRGSTGLISWTRTIAKMQPALNSAKQPIYLDFITKRIRINEDALVTLIHEYCLSLAFSAIGWLYTPRRFKKPKLDYITEEHLNIVARRLGAVFHDRSRRLLTAMYNILSHESGVHTGNYQLGTERFEYAWEYMIQQAFGEQPEKKRNFFPCAEWELASGKKRIPAPLEPDTIMAYSDNLYVLDAKYYRYGVSGNPTHLPGTSDIGKQVIYGQYAKKVTSGIYSLIFNAFIIPGDHADSGNWAEIVAIATPSWITAPQPHERVLTIAIDTAHLLRNYGDNQDVYKRELSMLIQDHFEASHSP